MFHQLINHGMIEAMTLDRTIHRLKHLEALKFGLLTENEVWRRWLV